MTERHLQRAETRATDASPATRTFASSLHGLLEVTRAVRSGADVGSVLKTTARVVSEALGFQTIVLNVYRPEWDDFYVETVHGSDAVRETLQGSVYGWESWQRLLDPQFLREGAYFIPDAGEPMLTGPLGWHPNDELFVPLHRSDGQIVGVMSFGDPISGLRPDDEQLAFAVALASHAAVALETAQERERLQRHQTGLEQLLHVSSQLPQTMSTEAMLTSVCEAVREALDFDKVLIQLCEPDGGRLRSAASAGWAEGGAVPGGLELPLIERLFDPAFEIEGCYLIPHDDAERRVGREQVVYASVMNGKGPLAWNHHWLVVPLYGADGEVRGVLWADEPRSRLLPNHDVLQALRIFANHAMEALAVATQLAETKFLADHDPLTRLLNRRALLQRLGESERLDQALALVFLDLDNFKEVNDGHGHAVGDRVLARFASLLAELAPGDALAFRVGGDEFALLLPNAGEQEARDLIGRVRAAVQANIDPLVRSLRASFGIAANGNGRRADELLRVADEAMYAAKRAGGGIEIAA